MEGSARQGNRGGGAGGLGQRGASWPESRPWGPRVEAASVPGTQWGIQQWDLESSGVQASHHIGEFLPKRL